MNPIQGIKKLQQYNLAMLITNGLSYVYTKIFWRRARLVRFPIKVYGKKYIKYGNGLTIGSCSKIDIAILEKNKCAKLFIGENCVFGDMLHIAANKRLTIGNNLLAASRVFITDTSHGNYSLEVSDNPRINPVMRKLACKETRIGDNVWLGENVCVLAGAIIGDGCIIGANSVVTKEIPDYSIAVGAPAKVVKVFNKDTNEWIAC